MRLEQTENRNRKGTSPLVLVSCAVALAASGGAHAARPVPNLNASVCASISGSWVPPTCTIPEGSNGVATSDFRITRTNAIDVKGSLTVNAGVIISNAGTITVENTSGVTLGEFEDADLTAGVLILGTIDNSGTITIQNAAASTAGIAISVSVSQNDPSVPNPWLVVPGVLSNAGTITVQNTGQTQGINNLGTLNNAASGIITIANALTGSVGIRNRRDVSLGSQYYIVGTMTNAGSITTGSGGDGESRGISSSGAFTNAATGTFTIGASAVTDVLAYGFRNNGSFTNLGTFINNRGSYDEANSALATWGSYNLGTMINYGKTYTGTSLTPTGSFFNEGFMVNIGEISSYGTFFDGSGFMVNYETFYNYGLIIGGGNLGICIDEPGSLGGC